jgi:hypothetical protein
VPVRLAWSEQRGGEAPNISQQIEKSGAKKKKSKQNKFRCSDRAKAVIPADIRMPFALRKVSPLIDRLRQETR